MSGRRTDRLAAEIQEGVAELLAHGLKDPRIGFVTVTRVDLTADLRLARIYVGILGGPADREKTLAGLAQATGFVRRELGKRIRVRHVPEVVFLYDEGLNAAERIAQILDQGPEGGDGE